MNLTKVDYHVEKGLALITMNHPASLNVLDETMQRELIHCFGSAEFDPEVKVVVLQAEGAVFSGGGDIKGILSEAEKPADQYSVLEEGLTWPGTIAKQIRGIRKPVIAAVNGAAAGAAANLALWCDFRIASEDMVLIEAFIKIGLVTDGGGVYILNKLIGAAKTTELVMTGRAVKAPEALSLGLVNEVVPVDKLRERTLAFAEKLAAGPGVAYGHMKALINQTAFPDMNSVLETEALYQSVCVHSRDCLEGMKAFIEKRPAKFEGR
jgi:2-(1,2-epoxy-1,2-dihydrophenyl)acetyl-CoA isomerase